MATNGNDTLAFLGQLGHLSMLLTNPYTGDSIYVDDDFNINISTYDGLAGNDTLSMTTLGDAIFLDGPGGTQMVRNVEVFSAGRGGDLVILSSNVGFALGNLSVSGGESNDVLWSNVGSDSVSGNNGNDHIVGGAGSDSLSGGAGADFLNGGTDPDWVRGDGDNDVLQFFADSSWVGGFAVMDYGGVARDSMSTIWSIPGYVDASHDVYDGGTGYDILQMSDSNEALFLDDVVSPIYGVFDPNFLARVNNIEQVNAGGGNDIVDFTSTRFTYGDIVINGGAGNDWVRGAMGDDTLHGEDGNDSLYGMMGHDSITGGEGNDVLYGGEGNDRLDGGDGNDVLYGGDGEAISVADKDFADPIVFPGLRERVNISNLKPPGDPSLGVAAGNLHIDFDATATITFKQGYAGYNNSLGVYSIAADGTIESAKMLFKNVKTAGYNKAVTIDLPTDSDGTDLGFFIIANGDNTNAGYKNLNLLGTDGAIKFYYDYNKGTERLAKITDDGAKITAVYDDGLREVVLKGPVYHTTERGESALLNPDHKVHVVSGLANPGSDDVLRIGFEDLPALGDADYEDVWFDLNINPGVTDLSEAGNDVLIGGAGNDTLYGLAGDDLLVVGVGRDEIYGGTGSDTILYEAFDLTADILHDFTKGVGGDKLNISNILEGFDTGDVVANFVRLVSSGGNTNLQVNTDGDVGGAFSTIAVFQGGISGTAQDLVNSGNLVLNNPMVV